MITVIPSRLQPQTRINDVDTALLIHKPITHIAGPLRIVDDLLSLHNCPSNRARKAHEGQSCRPALSLTNRQLVELNSDLHLTKCDLGTI